ncbi:MAG: VTT domain-containing protein [Rhodocyclales bacterium]|nr:VTT domain-containing protein [Rhodocyclales bacterium]
MATLRAKVTRTALAIALAAGLAIAIANRDAFSQEALQQWLAAAGWWAPLAFVAIYAAATVLFLPGSVLTLAAGVLFGVVGGALYSLAGATLGAVLAFLIARHVTGDWVARKAGGWLKQLIEGVEAEGWRFVAFVRLVPLFPFNVVNYALGLTRIPLAAYALASAVCMLPGAFAYAWLGQAGRAALAGDAGAVKNGLLALALAAALMFLPRLIRQFKAGLLITPEMAKALCDAGSTPIIDVREAKDFDGETGHVPGALNIPLGELPARVAELEPWRNEGVVLICRTQVRSGQAARLLARQGFARLRVVNGGMLAWRERGFPAAWNERVETASANTRA